MNELNTQNLDRLVLLTTTASKLPEITSRICRQLFDMNIMQGNIGELDNYYAVGEGFMQHIIFMGCSPAIELQIPEEIEPDNLKFTFVKVSQNIDNMGKNAVPYYGANVEIIQQVPRCHACRKPVKADISEFQSSIKLNDQKIQCHACQQTSKVSELDWRKQTGWGNIFIEIYNVYPHEAVPTDGLLQTLAEITHSEWKYFYTQYDFEH